MVGKHDGGGGRDNNPPLVHTHMVPLDAIWAPTMLCPISSLWGNPSELCTQGPIRDPLGEKWMVQA